RWSHSSRPGEDRNVGVDGSSFRLHDAGPAHRARHARPGDPREACRALRRVSAGSQDHPAAFHREPPRRPGQRRAAATDAAGGLCAFSPGSDGRADGTGVQADRFSSGGRRVHIVCPVTRTAVVPRIWGTAGTERETANHRGRQSSMSAIPMAITAQDVAKGLSMFEIDESLEALVEAAEQEAEANGEISEDIKTAL